MLTRLKIMIALGVIVLVAVGMAPTIVLALADTSQSNGAPSGELTGTDSDDPGSADSSEPITGPDLDRAGAAALAHTGGGTVTDTEVGDEESYYEVEVRLADGSQVDVQLDETFTVIGSDPDTGGDEGSTGD